MRVPVTTPGNVAPTNNGLRGPSGQGGTPEAFGAGVGRGVQNLGQTVTQLGDYFSQKNQETQRFDAMSRFSDYATGLNNDLTTRARQYDPSMGATFVPDIKDLATKRKQDFIGTLPPDLQPEFSARAEAVNDSLFEQSLKVQLDARDGFAKNTLNDAYTKAQTSLDQDGSATNLDAQRALLDNMLDASGLSNAEKVSIRRQFYTGMESVSYKSEVRNGKIQMDALGVGSPAQAGAYQLIQEFTPKATPDEAKQTAKVAEQVAVAQLKNPLIWAGQNDPTKAALLALIADKGELPASVVTAMEKGGDVAKAVEDLGGDRRKAEAAVIRGDALLQHSMLDADPRYADIPYEDRLAIRHDAEVEATHDQTVQAAADKARNASVVNALQVGLYDGTAGQQDIDAVRSAGIMTDIDDIQKSQAILAKRDETVNLAAKGQQMLSDGVTFNPNDPDHVKIENALVGKEGINALNHQDSSYAANTLVPMVRSMQDVPPDVAGLLTGMIRSNDQSKALWAMDLLSQLQQASPKGYDARTTDPVAKDIATWQATKDYYPQDQLFQLLRGGDTQEMRVRTQALREDAKKLLSDPKAGPTITGDVMAQLGITGGTFGFGRVQQQVMPQASQAAMAEFTGLFQEQYGITGDAASAKTAALQLLKKNWGVTSVGGGNYTLMKYPPEKVYPAIDGNYDWINQQAAADMKLAPGETFQLIADDQTREEMENWRAGGPNAPSYQAVIVGADGNWRLFDPGWNVKSGDGQWDPSGNRLFFDTKPVIAAQAQEWMTKRVTQNALDSQKVLGQALVHEQETGTPIPQDILTTHVPGAASLEEWQQATGTGGGMPHNNVTVLDHNGNAVNH